MPKIIQHGEDVIGIDIFNGYYSPSLKICRVEKLIIPLGSRVINMDEGDYSTVCSIYPSQEPYNVMNKD